MAEEITVIVDDTQEEVSLFVDSGITVDSVFGRTGNVVAVTGDYDTSEVPEVTNLYYTEARVSANAAVVLNTAKDGITPAQASEITDQANQITTSRFEARCLGQAVDGRVDNYASALANIGLKETSTASLLFDAKICGVGQGKLFNLLPFDSYKDFDVVRNGTATYVGSDGLIKTALANVPRIDWTDSANPVSLTEPQGTNLITYSDDFSEDTAWLKSLITVTLNNTVSPDGTNNADKLESTGAGSLRTNSAIAFVDDYSYSVFVKKGNSRYITLRSAFFTTNINVGFDLDTATSETGGVIEVLDNDWFRLSISKDISLDADKSGYFYTYFPSSLGGQTSVSGNYFYMWGCNVEDSAVPSSFIPTEGSTVTRIADVVTGAGSVNDFNSEEGVLFVEMAALSDDLTSREVSISDSTSTNRIEIRYSSVSNRIQGLVRVGGAIQANMTFVVSDITDFNSIALKYKQNNFALYIDGIEEVTGTSGTAFPTNTLSELSLDQGGGGGDFYGKIRKLRTYKSIALAQVDLPYIT